jgi:hypothetical protein
MLLFDRLDTKFCDNFLKLLENFGEISQRKPLYICIGILTMKAAPQHWFFNGFLVVVSEHDQHRY